MTNTIDKKSLSERDICTKFITPAIKDVAGWNLTQFFEEFTLGKIHVRGKSVGRGARDRADYILFYKKNMPLAIIEAKDNNHEIGAGLWINPEEAGGLIQRGKDRQILGL